MTEIKKKPSILAVIPVRMQSTRLPDKPLAPIAGKPLVLWVWEHAIRAKCFSKVCIATDSEQIRDTALAAGAEVIMTSEKPVNGTERVYEALKAQGGSWDIVFNVQGDMPFIQPDVIEKVASEFQIRIRDFEMATLAIPVTDRNEYESSSCVKVVMGQDHRALYFSRAAIPHYRAGLSSTGSQNAISQEPISHKHVGLYAFRPDALERLVTLPPSTLEKAESLEQLRALEHGFSILTVCVEREKAGPGIEVDTPADLKKANEIAKTYLMT